MNTSAKGARNERRSIEFLESDGAARFVKSRRRYSPFIGVYLRFNGWPSAD